MPVNVVKTMRDEKAWQQAKKSVGSKGGKGDNHWRYVMGVFKKIRENMRKGQHP
jgi:hypothetical protein